MNLARSWMYKRYENGFFSHSFIKGVDQFVQYATSQPNWMDGTRIKCPCNLVKCRNRKYLDPDTVKLHLQKNGFVPNYYVWIFHGETNLEPAQNHNVEVGGPSNVGNRDNHDITTNAYSNMIHDVARPQFEVDEKVEEPPNAEAKVFYDMLAASEQELWPRCKKHSELSLVARLVTLKSNHRLSERCYDEIIELMKAERTEWQRAEGARMEEWKRAEEVRMEEWKRAEQARMEEWKRAEQARMDEHIKSLVEAQTSQMQEQLTNMNENMKNFMQSMGHSMGHSHHP